MVTQVHRIVAIALRVLVAGVCCIGIWYSWNLARADYLFRKDTEASVRSALRLVPDSSTYYMRLAQFDRANTRELLTTALRLNQYNAQADIELGMQFEAEGNDAQAEKQLLAAYAVDHTYVPRWTLANYYFRQNNMPEFWAWARRAAETPSENTGPLFELCWRASPDPDKITSAILNENPELIRQYLSFLLGKNQSHAIASIAPRLIRSGTQETDRPMLLAVINRLVALNDAEGAQSVWHALLAQRWAFGDGSVPNNGGFVREPLPVSFDWGLPEYVGLHSWPGPSGLQVELTGDEPEYCTIAEQSVALAPGTYKMTYSYHTTDIATKSGILWQVIDPKSNAILAESPDLSSESLTNSAFPFSLSDASLLRVRLVYRRVIGTPRISGTLVIVSTQIRTQPSS